MKDYEAFALLNIEKTKDENSIRQAYHRELPKHHPEEDPEGFKKLREAYEEASKYARTPDSEEGEIITAPAEWGEDTPVSRFMMKIADLYTHYELRISEEKWEEVLNLPEVSDFDWEEEIRKALFMYLSDHFRLPSAVWRLLDRTFFIEEREAEFLEILPEGFLTFIRNRLIKASYSNDFEYYELSGYPEEDNEGKIDSFIDEILNHIDEEVIEKSWIDHMKTFGMEHPWLSICECISMAGNHEVGGLMEKTKALTEKYPDDMRLQCGAAEVFASLNDSEDLKSAVKKVMKSDYSRTRLGYKVCILEGDRAHEEGDLLKAFKAYEKAASISYTRHVAERLPDISKKLTEQLLKKDDLTEEESLILCQGCDVSGLTEEGIKYFRKHVLHIQRDNADFCYWYACLFDSEEHLEEAREMAEMYKKAIETEYSNPESDEEKYKKSKEESRYLLLKSHILLLDKENRNENKDRILELINEAEKICPDLCDYVERRISTMFELEEYESIVEEAENALKTRQNDYNLLSALQAAYSRLRMYQNSVDIFHRARALYDNDPSIYERACKAFRVYGQFKDVLSVIEKAKEGEAMSEYLEAEEVYATGMLIDGPEGEKPWRDCIDKLLLMQRNWSLKDEKEQDKEAIANANLFAGLLLMDKEYGNRDENYTEAEKLFDRSLYFFETEDAHFRRGRLYLMRYDAEKERDTKAAEEHRKEAYTHLRKAYDMGYNNAWLSVTLSHLTGDNGDYREAIRILTPWAENHEHLYSEYENLATWNTGLFASTFCKEYAEEAFRCCEIYENKVGFSPDIYYDRGEVYFHMGEYENAEAEFGKAVTTYIEQAGEQAHPFFLAKFMKEQANAKRKLGEYEAAIRMYRNALEKAYSDEYRNPGLAMHIMHYLTQTYLLSRDYAGGIRYFWDFRDQADKRFNDSLITEETEDMLSDLVFSQGTEQSLLNYHKEKLKPSSYIIYTGDAFNWEKSTDQFYKVMLAHLHFPNVFTPEDTKNVLRGAMSVANTPMRENDISPMDRYRFMYNLGCFLLYFHGDDESAIKYLKEAESGYKNVFSPSIKERIYEGLMWLNHFKGFDAVAAEYAKKYEEEAANTYEYCRYAGKTLEEAVEEPLYWWLSRLHLNIRLTSREASFWSIRKMYRARTRRKSR